MGESIIVNGHDFYIGVRKPSKKGKETKNKAILLVIRKDLDLPSRHHL